ncbi:MAG: hypothetical protein ACFB4I_15270 [Cyanophyceae cyanobacterium]
MIHHLSIPAQDPLRVAKVLAELFGNRYYAPFPSHPDSYVAFAGDEYGTLIEVYPLGTEMIPGAGDNPICYQQSAAKQFIATHAAISIPIDQAQIESIARRENWRCLRCSRGYFDVIEFWIENAVLLELATPELAHQYLTALASDNLAKHFAQENT